MCADTGWAGHVDGNLMISVGMDLAGNPGNKISKNGNYRLIVFDLDGTITKEPSVWEFIHKKLGIWDSHGKRYLQEFLEDRDFERFAKRCAMSWKGVSAEALKEMIDGIEYAPGMPEVIGYFRKNGLKTAIVSSGLSILAERVKREIGIDYYIANDLMIRDGRVTGEIAVNVPSDKKAQELEKLAKKMGIRLIDTIAVGDGYPDIGMFRIAGFSIAINACREVADAADHEVGDATEIIDLVTF